MNAIALSHDIDALPTVLDRPSPSLHRRHRIDQFDLVAEAVERFNRLLNRLDANADPLDADRIATAARELCDANIGQPPAPCIARQMRRATTLVCMTGDPDWKAANDAGDVARMVIDYVSGDGDLIPDDLPRVGRLDDAIVIRTAWPRLADEVADYLDFCRIRRLEARLRGVPRLDFHMDRDAWRDACRAEFALDRHQRHVRETSYVPAFEPLFRVH